MENVLCAKSELCIFEPMSMQVVMESASWCDIHPIASIDGTNSIEFLISGATTNYLDLNDTVLALTCKVSKPNGTAYEKDKLNGYMTSNYLLHALFNDVKVFLNDIQIEGGEGLYPFKAVIQNELNFSDSTKDIQFGPCGYSDDDATLAKYCDGKNFSIMGSLNIDFFQSQSKYLLPGVDIKIILDRNKQSFVFNTTEIAAAGDSKNPHLKILDAELFVRKVQCAPAVLLGHELGLEKQNAMYPYQRMECLSYSIAQGSSSFSQENLFRGIVPKFAIVAMVSQSALQGQYNEDPFSFEPFGVNFVSLYYDGQALPYRTGYRPQFNRNLYTKEYFMSIIQNMEHMRRNINNGISLSDFGTDKTFFTFNLTPDFCVNQSQPPKKGNLRLELKFDKHLSQAVSVLVIGIYDSIVQITKSRRVLRA